MRTVLWSFTISLHRKSLLNSDRLNHASRAEVAKATVQVFNAIQDLGKEVQSLALAAAFTLLMEVTRSQPQDVFTATKNLMFDPVNPHRIAPQFSAMQFHLETEVTQGRDPVPGQKGQAHYG